MHRAARPRYLNDSAVTASTHTSYRRAFSAFLAWAQSTDLQLTSARAIDRALSDYAHDLYARGRPRSQLASTVFGLKFFWPQYRGPGRFPSAEQALRGWSKREPSASYPPLSWDAALLIAFYMLRHYGAVREATAVLLAFDCYTRVSELLAIRACDVALPSDARLGSSVLHGAGIRLPRTKTGSNQFVRPRKPVVLYLLAKVLAASQPTSRLFPFSAGYFRAFFRSVCHQLHLDPAYTLHSLRHGGATHDSLCGEPPEFIMVQGRWASVKSLRRYLQLGRALLLAHDLPAHLLPAARSYARHPVRAMRLAFRLWRRALREDG